MITSAIFGIIGLAICVGCKFADKSISFPDVWTEFFGDGIQGTIDFIYKKIKKSRENKRLEEITKSLLQRNSDNDAEIFVKILNEVKLDSETYTPKSKEDNGFVEKWNAFWNRFRSKKIIDGTAIVKLSNSILWNYDYREYLSQNTVTFRTLNEKQQDDFIELIKTVIKVYCQDIFAKTDEQQQVMAAVIVGSLKQYLDQYGEEIVERLNIRIQETLSHIAMSGEGASLQQIETARFAPKYILNACPECGYNGDRIYTDDNGVMHCAACDAHFSLQEYCEPEWWAKVNEHLKGIDNKVDKLLDLQDKSNEEYATIKQMISEGVKEEVFKRYLDDCLKEQTDKLLNNNDTLIEAIDKSFEKYSQQLAVYLNQQAVFNERVGGVCLQNKVKLDELCSVIENLNEENKRYNVHLSQKIDALDRQIAIFYDEAMSKLTDNGQKNDMILEYVKRMCTKEYLEDVSNALGSNLSKAMASENQKSIAQIKALNDSSVAQIMSRIDQLGADFDKIKSNCSGNNDSLNSKMEELLRNESATLNSQINSLQTLIESDKEESRLAFRTIIKSQDEIKAILLGSVGLNVNKHDFEKMYSGKIPSEMLYNEGFGGEFPCPYCGAVEDRRMNEDQYCKCSVCGNKFLGVDPFWQPPDPNKTVWTTLKDDYGRDCDTDPMLAEDTRVQSWRKAFTAKCNGSDLEMPDIATTKKWSNTADNLVILPKDISGFNMGEIYNFAEIVIIPSNYTEFVNDFFRNFIMLRTIVFMIDDDGYYLWSKMFIDVSKNVRIYGKTDRGEKIIHKS